MFDSVIHARTHFLKPNGFLLPSRSTINLSMLHDDEWINDRLHYWNDVYGFKMTSMKKFLFGDAIVDCIGKDVFGSNAAVIFVIIFHIFLIV